jgi:hypothetical protein
MKAQWLLLKNGLGWQGILGVLLLVAAYLFNMALLAPTEQRVAGLRTKLSTLTQGMKSQARAQEAEQQSPSVMLEKFYAFFISNQSVTDKLAEIFSLAEANGLELRQGEYKLKSEKSVRLVQYQIAIPARGGYLQIRTFISQVLKKIPTASLDQIRFERKRAGDANVEAEIKFTLYMVQP